MNPEKKICVSIGEKSVSGVIRALQGLSFAEIRLDLLEKKPSAAEVKEIFSSPVDLIATCRPGKLSEDERKALLLSAINCGAKYADLEVENRNGFNSEVVEIAKKNGCQVIVSFHDHSRTPPEPELEKIIDWCLESGADIAKIACKANTLQDCARLLGLLDSERKLVVIGMGEEGRIVRILAPLLGSQFTYASTGKGKETAEGQLETGELKKIFEVLK